MGLETIGDIANAAVTDNSPGGSTLSWSTASDWDSAQSESGTVHESVTNTDYNDESTIEHGYSIENASGLLAYYPLQEQSGTTAYEASGNEQNGVYNGATPNGQSLDGVTGAEINSGRIAIYPKFESSRSTLTVMAWYKPKPNEDKTTVVSHDRSEYYLLGHGNFVGEGDAYFSVSDSGGGTLDLDSDFEVDDQTVHHLAGRYDNGNVAIFVDGVKQATGNKGSQLGTGKTRYGFIGEGSEADSFNGNDNNRVKPEYVWDYRLYSGALSDSQIKQYYETVSTSGLLKTAKKSG